MRDSGEAGVRALLERIVDEICVVVTDKGWCVCVCVCERERAEVFVSGWMRLVWWNTQAPNEIVDSD